MSTTVFIARHAEVDNPENIEYMRLPGFGLSDWGEVQARELATALATEGIQHIYSSPLLRTKQTARICSQGKRRVRYCDEFLEANYKKWEGLRKIERDPNEVAGYQKDPVKYSAILGESLVDIQRRVVDKILELAEKHQGEKILIVTHAAPAIVARLFFEGRSLDEYQGCTVNFASLTTISFDDDLECRGVSYREYVKQKEPDERRQLV